MAVAPYPDAPATMLAPPDRLTSDLMGRQQPNAGTQLISTANRFPQLLNVVLDPPAGGGGKSVRWREMRISFSSPPER